MKMHQKQTARLCRIIPVVILIAATWPVMTTAAEPGTVYDLRADGLSCPFCAYGIEKQLGRIKGVKSVATDIKSGKVTVTMKAGARLDESDAKQAVDKAGFTLRSFSTADTDE